MKLLLAATAAVLLSTSAHAALQLAFSVGASTFSCTDGAACDLAATPGLLIIGSETLGGVTISGTFAASSNGPPLLRAINFSIANGNAANTTLLMAVGDTNFNGTATSFAGSAAGLWTGATTTANAAYGFWVDGTDLQGAATSLDLPGTNILDFLSNHSTGVAPNSFSDTASAAFGAVGPYSMTMGANFLLTGHSSLSGNEQAIEAVPEASTWLMGLTGFGLVGALALRKGRKDRLAFTA